jgi:hypothetical protein
MNKLKTLAVILLIAASSCVTGLQAHELSTRGHVGLGNDVMIAGVIVEDRDCPVNKEGKREGAQFILRVLGPSLEAVGVTDVLSDPAILFYDENGNLIGGESDYTEVDATSQFVIWSHGLAPSDAREVALYFILPPGVYTAIVYGQNGEVGNALLEAYKL